MTYLPSHRYLPNPDGSNCCGQPAPDRDVNVCARLTDHPIHAVRDDVEQLASGLAAYQWNQPADYPTIWANSEHRRHHFYGGCAICQGDLHAIAAVALSLLQEVPQ